MKATKENFCILADGKNAKELKEFFEKHFDRAKGYDWDYDLGGYYYCFYDDMMRSLSIKRVNEYGLHIITLAEARAMFEPEKQFPRMMLVRDLDKEKWVKREIDGIINGIAFSVTANIFYWLQHKELPGKNKVTQSDLMNCYAEKHGISVDDIEVI